MTPRLFTSFVMMGIMVAVAIHINNGDQMVL